MAAIEVFRVEIENEGELATNTPFTVNVPVENHNTLGPVLGGCVNSGVEGHKVRVRLNIEHAQGATAWSGSQTVCAPIQSTLAPNVRARFTPELEESGEYIVRAYVQQVNGASEDTSEAHRIQVSDDVSTIPLGGTEGQSEDTAATGQDGSPLGGGSGSGVLAWVMNNQQQAATILLVLAFLYVAGPFAEVAANVTEGS